MRKTARAFIDEMDRLGIKYNQGRDTDDGKSIVMCSVRGKNNAVYEVFFIFDQDDSSVCMQVFKLVTFPEDRTARIFDTLNELNRKYRWLKFYSDHDCNIHVQEDAALVGEDGGKYCVRMLLRIMKIIDEAYPEIMRALWA